MAGSMVPLTLRAWALRPATTASGAAASFVCGSANGASVHIQISWQTEPLPDSETRSVWPTYQRAGGCRSEVRSVFFFPPLRLNVSSMRKIFSRRSGPPCRRTISAAYFAGSSACPKAKAGATKRSQRVRREGMRRGVVTLKVADTLQKTRLFLFAMPAPRGSHWLLLCNPTLVSSVWPSWVRTSPSTSPTTASRSRSTTARPPRPTSS